MDKHSKFEQKNIIEYYDQLVIEEKITPDNEQLEIIKSLYELERKIVSSRASFWGSIFSKADPFRNNSKRGIYIFGDVGRGKSMLMDMFFELSSEPKKRRIHFHEFMIEVHNELRDQRSKQLKSDPLYRIAKKIATETRLLCFDEFNVTDITDAMILKRLFEALFKYNIILVTTSNCRPENLYKDGLQRELFLPFIELLESSLDIYELNADHDYRLSHLKSLNRTYFTPCNESTSKDLETSFNKLTNFAYPQERVLICQGKEIVLEKTHSNICWTNFDNLCCKPLGTNDYIKICNNFDIIILESIPKMAKDNHNEAKRFTNLIDIIYDSKVKLICNAEVSAENLYTCGKNSFEFKRTVSRLIEMQSEQYLEKEHL